ncbi:hypothetical protein SAMN05421510_100139 [Nitrosomonas ureae]|uniref:Uncharacterized protein n=1 Tax=Nitrosomonas ureae TaxID=44577 RepID=A0A1H8ZHA0_9PROT|nr:hypothetical protein SAMN05421510_100139 [Nitrosomonas ureae]
MSSLNPFLIRSLVQTVYAVHVQCTGDVLIPS